MARKKPEARQRIDRLSDDQVLNLVLGVGFMPEVFKDDRQRREAWQDHKESILAQLHPDQPPPQAAVDYEGDCNQVHQHTKQCLSGGV